MLKYNVFLEILLLLSLLASWSSQTLLDICVVVMLLTMVLSKNFLGLFKITIKDNKYPLLLFFGYFGIACFGYIFNARPEAELANLRKFDWILLYLIIYMVIKTLNGKMTSWYVDHLKYLLLIPALYGFSIFFTHNIDFLTGRLEADGRIVGMVNSPTYHAHVGVILLTVALILIWETKKYSVSNLACAMIIGASALLTRTRGAFIALIAGLAAYFITMLYKKGTVSKAKLILLAVFAVIGAILPAVLITRANSTSCRQLLLKIHVNIVKQYPILGIGYRDNLRDISEFSENDDSKICGENDLVGNQAHNQFLNVAATTGFLGLFFFTTFYFMFLVNSGKLILRTDISSNDKLIVDCVFSVLMVFTVSSMFEVMFEFAKIRHLIVVCWAFVHFYKVKYKKAI